MGRFFNTNAFRLAALYFALFAGSVLTLFAFFYLSTAGFIERQIEQTVGAEIRGLQEQYEQLGLGGLVALVRERSLHERVDNMIYVMTDPFLHEIAGNLSAWPRRTTSVKPGWITFPFEVHTRGGTETHTALGTQLIVGGDRLLVARDLRDATTFRQHVLSSIAWAALISLGLGIIGGLLMTRQMLRRVESVANTTRHIIDGDLAQRIPLTGSGDEFDQLGTNLNAMLDQIERLMVGMRQVTDNIAHDLRTPLSRLRSRLEVTLLEKPNAARYAEVLNETIAEADQLLGTFNALLSIAEAEAGSRRDAATTADLAEIARNVAELYEPVADDKGLTLAVSVPDSLPVRGDRHLLSQAIANLLDNALKYTPSGTVSLSVRREGDTARVEVADTGPGIPVDRREVVFDRFVRLEGSRSTPGNGLGLSLVRAVAKLHDGRVRLDDNNPGLKAIFVLPATPVAQPEPLRASDARPAA
ncbi:MAG: sensor histidine kinase [Stellaceae bacterium]